jgi:hypothetical protein
MSYRDEHGVVAISYTQISKCDLQHELKYSSDTQISVRLIIAPHSSFYLIEMFFCHFTIESIS